MGHGLPGGKDSAEAGDIDRPVAGAELGLPVVGLLVTDAADVAAVERPEACCGGAGARFVSKPESGGDRVAGRHPVTVGIARSGVEHHCARGDAGRECLVGIERALMDAGQARPVEELPDEKEKIVTRQRLARMKRHPVGNRDIDDPAGVGGRFHRWFPRVGWP